MAKWGGSAMIGCDARAPADMPVLVRDRRMESEARTAAAGAAIARLVVPGDVLALWGGLGSGKTVFARGFIRAWLGEATEVPSPTFTLVQIYEAPPPLAAPIHHFDLFRLGGPDEAVELGIEDAFAAGVALVEWPDRLGDLLPDIRLDVSLTDADHAEARYLTLSGPAAWRCRLEEAAIWMM